MIDRPPKAGCSGSAGLSSFPRRRLLLVPAPSAEGARGPHCEPQRREPTFARQRPAPHAAFIRILLSGSFLNIRVAAAALQQDRRFAWTPSRPEAPADAVFPGGSQAEAVTYLLQNPFLRDPKSRPREHCVCQKGSEVPGFMKLLQLLEFGRVCVPCLLGARQWLAQLSHRPGAGYPGVAAHGGPSFPGQSSESPRSFIPYPKDMPHSPELPWHQLNRRSRCRIEVGTQQVEHSKPARLGQTVGVFRCPNVCTHKMLSFA